MEGDDTVTSSPATATWPPGWTLTDQRAVDTARVLAADAVERAGNGHPGTAISLAPVAYLLFQNVMRHDPTDPAWPGRDRFVLSCGHTSLTLYTQLFLAGYGLELQDLKDLRQWGSKTPGHPEVGHTAGVEMTTGPLGQGLASAVGMAMAARRERGLFDPETPAGESPFDHMIYVIASDGDIQEGITSEASSLAGHQELGNLVVIYDDNQISIEDDTQIALSEDVLARYDAYGWHTQRVDWLRTGEYHEDVRALSEALQAAREATDRPSIISLRTIIGWPTPKKQDTGAIHGSKLGAEALRGLKEELGFNPDEQFIVDDEVLDHARTVSERARQARTSWDKAFSSWESANPDTARAWRRMNARELPVGWDKQLPQYEAGSQVATRKASGAFLDAVAEHLPELWGGSADLAGSNNTTMTDADSFIPAAKSTDSFAGHEYGRTLHFGIREHAMGAMCNGIALHGPTRPYCGTFLVFSDYMRASVRLGSLMDLPVTYVWTHDSIGLGEDGPTHQPIEHLASLRAMPGLDVVRPADANETIAVWGEVLRRGDRPTGLILTRQEVPTLERERPAAETVGRGGYVLRHLNEGAEEQCVIIATGSEVHLADEAARELANDGIGVRVVSMPCLEWFMAQPVDYRDSVIPPKVAARVTVEAGSTFGWHRFAGDHGVCVGLDHFGASADYERLFSEFGITTQAITSAARSSLRAVGAR